MKIGVLGSDLSNARSVAACSLNAPIDVWLIHGLGDSPRVWRRVRNDRALRRYRLFAPALPGFGGAAPLATRQRGVQGLATWLATQIARRSRGRHVVLVGHSMGGMLATLVASSHASIVGIVNIEGPLTLQDCDTARRASNAADFQAWFRAFRRAVRLPESGAPPHYAASVAEADPQMFLACAHDIVSLARGARMAKRYAALDVPAIYYYGSSVDGLSANSRRFLTQRGLTRERFAKAGHWPMTETPGEFAKTLARSLQALGVGARSS